MVVTVETLTSLIGQYLPEPHAGLLSGIAFGTRATMSGELLEALIKTGALHVVALSGMNISIIAGLISLTLLRVVSRRIASLLTVLLIIGFVWFVGPSASVIRAAIMGSISLAAIIFGRSNWPLLSWLLAVTVMLLLNPFWLGDISFQLSALATLGIILFGAKSTLGKSAGASILKSTEDPLSYNPNIAEAFISGASLSEERDDAQGQFSVGQASLKNVLPLRSQLINPLWIIIENDLRVTLAAQMFTIPLILFHFHRISLISPLPNVLVGWTIGLLTILGWLVGFSGILFAPLGQLVAWVAWVPLQYVLWVVMTTSIFPLASLNF